MISARSQLHFWFEFLDHYEVAERAANIHGNSAVVTAESPATVKCC